ncbi:MAG: DUF4450 domain-containing protein [Acidobacteriia bacterium]|nr:DUF4450 domain-containing protein [Terriglobia bacterium]
MPQSTRREFLIYSGCLLAAPSLAAHGPSQPGLPVPAAEVNEAPWREPGQTKDAAYLRTAALRYTAEGREIVGHNRTCFNNRPLYCVPPAAEGVVLAGDRPFLRLLAKPYVFGGFAAAIVRGSAGKWFHDYSEVESRYRCGRMTWRIHDPALAGVSVNLDAVPLQGAAGFALRLQAEGLRKGDQLIWAFGGAKEEGDVRWIWDPTMRGNPDVYKLGDPRKPQMNLGMDPTRCRGNQVRIEGQIFRLLANEGAARVAVAKSDREGKLRVSDASACSHPVTLANAAADQLPMACGTVDLREGQDTVFWVVAVDSAGAETLPVQVADPAQAFANGVAYLQSIERVEVETPEPRLDAAVAAVCHAIDASCDRDPFNFRHGCMAFSIHFLGWRVICGATALGWHERVRGNAAYYAASQVKDDGDRREAQPDPGRRYCIEGDRSRFYGRGRIPRDTAMYNTQSQFFDQAIRDWRWTADPEMEQILRPSLELHLEWARACFDPDDDGLYESYINTLPSDSVWYNGGGSVEESAYAYYGHLAARDMARRAGDADSAARHQKQAEKIRRAVTDVLWLNERGHFGLYVEQGGHHRVHSDAWVYSEFLPVDSGMTTPEQALQALYYTEWALERVRLPYGGEVCQPSNWVPWKWSVRDIFGGDVCALALACFQTGLSDEGWELLLGATLESAYAGAVPGGFSHIGAGTDFADNSHMFARTVVEGLFGYDPDYPNELVHMRPAIPSSWPKACISTPDFTLEYRQEDEFDKYRLTLARGAGVDFRLPVRAEKVRRVTLNGADAAWSAEAGFGCTWVRLRTQKLESAEVAIEISNRVPQGVAIKLAGKVGEEIRLASPHGDIVRWHDFHNALAGARADGSVIHGCLAQRPGHHIVLAEVQVGELPQRRVFKLHVTDPEGEANRATRTPREAPKDAGWTCLDLMPHYNGDIKTIFKQQYLLPRPKTCSVRLGVDGFSAWTFAFWGDVPPVIDLSNVEHLSNGQGYILTPQNVPFRRCGEDRNIAFTSLWDNWPRSVTVPVNQGAEAAWLLLCGSTFPMQTRIANAEMRFRYADGQVERLELVPPLNFWSLCPWGGKDYDYRLDAFCLPELPPPTVQLGRNCRAMVLSWKLRPNVTLKDLTLETLSQDVVIGLMGVSLMNAKPTPAGPRRNAF